MEEHPVDQPILAIDVTPSSSTYTYQVGRDGVTRIEACTKSGMYANVAYVRVWRGETALAEFCQHNIVGVYFEIADPGPPY